MRTVEIDDVKDLSGLLQEAAKGDPFLVARDGKPLVEVTVKAVPQDLAASRSWIGALEGMYTVPDDFDTMADKEFAEMMDIIENKKF
jgi:antitoxin (DNA-binding transcriptional repressor) of toxin-antitoxin stability system